MVITEQGQFVEQLYKTTAIVVCRGVINQNHLSPLIGGSLIRYFRNSDYRMISLVIYFHLLILVHSPSLITSVSRGVDTRLFTVSPETWCVSRGSLKIFHRKPGVNEHV